MEKLIHEYRGWLLEAWEKRILHHDPKVGQMQRNEGRVTNQVHQGHQDNNANNNKNKGCYIL